MNRNVIVFGATGNTGAEICKELEASKIQHAAFVRNGSESKVKTKSSRVISGDVLQMNEVGDALKSQEFSDVIIALGSRDLKSENVRSTGTQNIVEVLKSNAIPSKLHVISAHGVGNSWGRLKWHEKLISKLFIAKTMKDHELQEKIVESYSGGFHIIRPVALTNDPGTGKVISQNEGSMPKGSISRTDVAKFLVESMLADVSGENSICNL